MKSLVVYCGLILAFLLSCTEQAGVKVRALKFFPYLACPASVLSAFKMDI